MQKKKIKVLAFYDHEDLWPEIFDYSDLSITLSVTVLLHG